MPAFSQARLKRRRAASKYSFSRTRTLGIETSNSLIWLGIPSRRPAGRGSRGQSGAGILKEHRCKGKDTPAVAHLRHEAEFGGAFGNLRRQCRRRGEVRLAGLGLALVQPGEPPAIERPGDLR